MDLKFVKELGVDFLNPQSATLNNFCFQTNVKDDLNPTLGYPNIVPIDGAKVEGVLMKVPKEQLHLLDTYEGYPELYQRQKVSVWDKNQKSIEAFAYIGSPIYSTQKDLKLSSPIKERIRNGFVFLSNQYKAKLDSYLAK